MVYTLDYDLGQLNRMQSRITAGLPCRIIHLLHNDSVDDDRAGHWQDRYIVLIDCDHKTYTLLCLL